LVVIELHIINDNEYNQLYLLNDVIKPILLKNKLL
jgi:hypothetical protein